MLHTDSFFAIGQKHVVAGVPCQDYAMSGVHDEGKLAFAVVSDGCSTGRNTDVGARLLVLSTIQAIREYWAVAGMIMPCMSSWVGTQRLCSIKKTSVLLGVTEKDLLATSIFACFSETSGFVRVQGDGVIAVKYRDGSILFSRFDWPNNMPFYPTYEGGSLKAFINAHGGNLLSQIVTEEKWHMDKDGLFSEKGVVLHSMKDGIKGIQLHFEVNNEIEFAAVFSDGITQIDNVDWKDAVMNFMSFKNTAGVFAKRRMIAGIREAMKFGKGPFDDISYAVIHITNDLKEGEEP